MNNAELIRAYPELGTRPRLMDAMAREAEFRRDVLRCIDHIFSISSVKHAWVSRYALNHYTRDVKQMLAKWHPRFEAGDHLVNNELGGAMRNILTNARLRIGISERFAGIPTGVGAEHFVSREWVRAQT